MDENQVLDDLIDLARATAFERYIQALLVKPASVRPHFITLAAFHGELARIPMLVNEPMMGEIRLQWWHDTIASIDTANGIGQQTHDSPLAASIWNLVVQYPGCQDIFLNAIDGRRRELDPAAFETEAKFLTYCDETWSAPLQLALEVTGHEIGPDDIKWLRSAGRALAAYELSQRMGGLLERGRMIAIPKPDSGSRGVGQSVPTHQSLIQVQQALAARAAQALVEYRALGCAKQPARFIAAVLPLTLVEPYFKPALRSQLEKPLQPLTPFGQVLRLTKASILQRL